MGNQSTLPSRIPNALSVKYGYNILFYKLCKNRTMAIRLFHELAGLVRGRNGKETENLWLKHILVTVMAHTSRKTFFCRVFVRTEGLNLLVQSSM